LNSVYYTLRNRPTYKDVIHKFKYNVMDTQTLATSYIYNEITCFQIERDEFLRTAVTYTCYLICRDGISNGGRLLLDFISFTICYILILLCLVVPDVIVPNAYGSLIDSILNNTRHRALCD